MNILFPFLNYYFYIKKIKLLYLTIVDISAAVLSVVCFCFPFRAFFFFFFLTDFYLYPENDLP